MLQSSFNKDIVYNDDKVAIKLIMETSFTKEIRILLKKGQEMKEHKTPYAIVIQLMEGSIDFGVNDEVTKLTKGDILTLEGNIPHNLIATADSMVRLTLSKMDGAARVAAAASK